MEPSTARKLSLPMFALLALAVASPLNAQAATLYPDLETFAPRELRFERTNVNAEGPALMSNVLRFSNTVYNNGAGRLEMRGQINPTTREGPAVQRIFDDAGGSTDQTVGRFYYHAAHDHYHYDDWGTYQLWNKSEYDAWVASGRTNGAAERIGTKTTSCVMDEEFIDDLPGTPYPARYPSGGCTPNGQNLMVQGLSPGWGDTYDYWRFEQWVDLGQQTLADGQYVLRSVTDPQNKIWESAGKADPAREGIVDNEGITVLRVQGGQILDSDIPSGTVTINDVDSSTASRNVTVKVIGRDDVSGVDQVRLSNNGQTWSTHNYTSTGSSPTSISWDLTNPTYGGTSSGGTKTVYAQFHDRTGKWSSTHTDTITYNTGGGGGSPYSSAVLADSPGGYWRLGETSGTTAADSAGGNTGTYRNAPQLDAASLLTGEATNRAVRFDGVNDHVAIPNSGSTSPTAQVTVEAWIKPEALPATGSFATIASKREAYALQFNGPRVEFTIMQGGSRKRAQAPVGAVAVGGTYHVVGTYNGTTSRLYVNGTEVATLALTGPIGTTSSGLNIASWSGSNEFMRGTVDEVAMYPTALSATRVQAHHAAAGGSGPPPPPPPVASPTNLIATAASTSSVALTWNDNSLNETEFTLERATNAAFTGATAIRMDENATAYTDTGLTTGTTYYYRIKALNASASSGWSNTASATTQSGPPPPPPPPSAYATAVGADNPISWWRLAEASGVTAVDQKAANPGNYLNGPVLGTPGLLGSDTANQAVRFDGSNDHVRIPNSPSLNLSTPITLEAWIKPTVLPGSGGFASILSKPEQYSLQFNGQLLEFTIIQLGSRKRLQAPVGTVVAGGTYHVVGTFDGGTRRLYVNGVQVAAAPLIGGATTTTQNVFAGSWNGVSEFFNGTLDEVAVYGFPLTPARVLAHYDAGK